MSYGKTQMNFLAISTDFMVVPLMPSLIIKEKSVKTNRKIQAKSHTKWDSLKKLYGRSTWCNILQTKDDYQNNIIALKMGFLN